jgi:hypothetical protein
VHVDARGIVEALARVYGVRDLLEELQIHNLVSTR